MKVAEQRAVLERMVKTERAEVPAALYPPRWLERAAAIESGDACPRDWQEAS